MSEELPSKHEANKMIRVLNDTPHKFTIVVHKKDGSKIEWQAEDEARIKWHDEARSLWIFSGQYGNFGVMAFEEGMVLLAEPNPEYKKP